MTTRILFLFAAATLCLSASVQAAETTARFVEPADASIESADGTLSLVWEVAGEIPPGPDVLYEVRRWEDGASDEAAGILVYEGQDTATFVSGLLEGGYQFKIRARPNAASFGSWPDESLQVDVVFHSRTKVVTLLLAGAVTLIVTVTSIVLGHRKALAA